MFSVKNAFLKKSEFLKKWKTDWPKHENLENDLFEIFESTEILNNGMFIDDCGTSVMRTSAFEIADIEIVIDENNYSSIDKLLNITAYVLIFVSNRRAGLTKTEKKVDWLNTEEIHEARVLHTKSKRKTNKQDKNPLN